MLKNDIIIKRKEALKLQRSILVKEKIRLSSIVKELKISKQAAWKQNTGKMDKIDEERMNERALYTSQLFAVDKDLQVIKEQLVKLHAVEDGEQNKQLKEVFKEIFSFEQMDEITKEAISRVNGNDPRPVSFSIKRAAEFQDKYYKYRELAKSQLDQMIKFRIMLTSLIEKGCDKWGNADFLQFMSPLNKLIIPLKELEKIKKDHLL